MCICDQTNNMTKRGCHVLEKLETCDWTAKELKSYKKDSMSFASHMSKKNSNLKRNSEPFSTYKYLILVL